ncbi:hypothetical protein [Geobacillus phage TP-84]|uniref:Uncharacterized protein n=1 Tax=Geobacillus phage TP-84 TaxID=1965361 RepID=A0A1U9WQS7_9CAUD|nr:hypothetical protein MUK65_gp14 [Geobacillus phage TP-84]AQY55112.1 hypothetical protein [Geobacillus phage TP-84]
MTVKEYLAKIPGADEFLALPEAEQEKWIFMAEETLRDHFHPRVITPRVVALQVMYMFEGESEDFAMLKRQGVDSFSTEGLSVSFKSGSIAPMVLEIVNRSGSAKVGRLI